MNTVLQFGRSLLATGDLDPIYLMLNSGPQDADTTARWCLAYWMFYHAGVASFLAESEGEAFWEWVWRAQEEKWPRGTERRHFKAENSRKAIEDLQRRFGSKPEDAVAYAASYANWAALLDNAEHLATSHRLGLTSVTARVRDWVGFGPWIAFKVADMLDAVIGVPVDFSNAVPEFFEDPLKGGVWVYAQQLGGNPDVATLTQFWEELDAKQRIHTVKTHVVPRLLKAFSGLVGPDGRGVRTQEVETILCKYKSHLNGHYPVGKDTREIIEGLDGWGDLAHGLRDALIESTPKEHHP